MRVGRQGFRLSERNTTKETLRFTVSLESRKNSVAGHRNLFRFKVVGT